MQTFVVHVAHDEDANLWWVEKSDIPGLNVEAPSYELLLEIVRDAAPDLLEANVTGAARGDVIPLAFRHATTARRALHA